MGGRAIADRRGLEKESDRRRVHQGHFVLRRYRAGASYSKKVNGEWPIAGRETLSPIAEGGGTQLTAACPLQLEARAKPILFEAAEFIGLEACSG